jgi:uncharacterized membrane protein YkvA (DUF1232 family)
MTSGAPPRSARTRRTRTARAKAAAVARAKAAPAGAADAAARRAGPPVLTERELRAAVLELANTLAPADVGDLLAEEAALRDRAAALDGPPGTLLRTQLDLALACLHDHAAGRCPQIPYYTISVLAAGLAYLVDELDLIPDFLPQIGTLDDALVMAMACRLGADGLRRYCTFKEIDPTPALGAAAAGPRTARAPRRSRRKE